MNRVLAPQQLVAALFGPLAPGELSTALGRRSATRRTARALGLEGLLPPPPPPEADPTLAYAAAVEARLASRLASPRPSANRGRTRAARKRPWG